MAGRPITVHTRKAQLDRERQRRNYANRKRQPPHNPGPIERAIYHWIA